MKIFLILMLVLGMASAANAALTWSVDEVYLPPGETVVVQLISDNDQSYTFVWLGADPSPTGVAEITGITALPAAAEGTAVLTSYPGWWIVEAVDSTPPSDIVAGPHFDVTIKGLSGDGTYTINSDFFETAGPNDTLFLWTPEPMSIALLGLGGLFMLRRRK